MFETNSCFFFPIFFSTILLKYDSPYNDLFSNKRMEFGTLTLYRVETFATFFNKKWNFCTRFVMCVWSTCLVTHPYVIMTCHHHHHHHDFVRIELDNILQMICVRMADDVEKWTKQFGDRRKSDSFLSANAWFDSSNEQVSHVLPSAETG